MIQEMSCTYGMYRRADHGQGRWRRKGRGRRLKCDLRDGLHSITQFYRYHKINKQCPWCGLIEKAGQMPPLFGRIVSFELTEFPASPSPDH